MFSNMDTDKDVAERMTKMIDENCLDVGHILCPCNAVAPDGIDGELQRFEEDIKCQITGYGGATEQNIDIEMDLIENRVNVIFEDSDVGFEVKIDQSIDIEVDEKKFQLFFKESIVAMEVVAEEGQQHVDNTNIVNQETRVKSCKPMIETNEKDTMTQVTKGNYEKEVMTQVIFILVLFKFLF